MIGHLILRLSIWFLLTANVSLTNIIIGVIIALLLPRGKSSPEKLKAWLKVIIKIIITIPLAFIEAFEIILRPHNQEEIIMEKVKLNRSPLLVFIDIFLITFTPKTIVLKYHEEGWYEVHQIKPGR
ncbi:Na+/H+ antiporter subunit E [Aphanizomenon flos-aquae NRERC-008]|jgi:multicomponent Na+:H+ antiporter subunit E|uniref:Na+/H+ antiporter subunit E n=1 Tax=Aphanizomenon flos-aquae FACHB-1249 TaxID=2692889 RepID=A0ABR8IVP5_APHFL|nr:MULTISPECIES: Na+/H+ antiporter subunit E [Aphanizomenon]MCE2906869.1 Na+/H+ antiporter subunit E [Anabaena sp. CoA2_C59]MDJ0506521.1 Na+/H+ antiporter subunit E [Nostocales cyanobacterium LE14-WE12]MBD2392237.1 Na+/H+ antiporter subunit E [Aphanizomenon flos-aquae FACHB-1171]MBD2558206.1 Na+/H+ antiporter subunit E [Aphanizomenon flos-aquae FACHB-1290]MBD2633274.1 Na+/H+ antiporter subunit E [Aphanizomenon sp. FACHB-1399]